jgi:hypothetical protein
MNAFCIHLGYRKGSDGVADVCCMQHGLDLQQVIDDELGIEPIYIMLLCMAVP